MAKRRYTFDEKSVGRIANAVKTVERSGGSGFGPVTPSYKSHGGQGGPEVLLVRLNGDLSANGEVEATVQELGSTPGTGPSATSRIVKIRDQGMIKGTKKLKVSSYAWVIEVGGMYCLLQASECPA